MRVKSVLDVTGENEYSQFVLLQTSCIEVSRMISAGLLLPFIFKGAQTTRLLAF